MHHELDRQSLDLLSAEPPHTALQAEWQLIQRLPGELAAGAGKRISEIARQPAGAAEEVGMGIAVTGAYLMSARVPGLGSAVRLAAKPLLAATAAVDIGRRLEPMQAVWQKPVSLDRASKQLGYNVGSMFIDYPLMAAGAAAVIPLAGAVPRDLSGLVRRASATEAGAVRKAPDGASDNTALTPARPPLETVEYKGIPITYEPNLARIKQPAATIEHSPERVSVDFGDGALVEQTASSVSLRNARGDIISVGRDGTSARLADGTTVELGRGASEFASRAVFPDGAEIQLRDFGREARVKDASGKLTDFQASKDGEIDLGLQGATLGTDITGTTVVKLLDGTTLRIRDVTLGDGSSMHHSFATLAKRASATSEVLRADQPGHPMTENGKVHFLTTRLDSGGQISKAGPTLITELPGGTQIYFEGGKLTTASEGHYTMREAGGEVIERTPDGRETVRNGEGVVELRDGGAIPPFTPSGNLPPGEFKTTWPEFVRRFDTSPRRHALLTRLEPRLIHLKASGVKEVGFGGSFLTTKEKPGDIDALFDRDGVDFVTLRQLDPPLATENPAWQRQEYEGINFADYKATGESYQGAKSFFTRSRPLAIRDGGNPRTRKVGAQTVGTVVIPHDALPLEPLASLSAGS